LKCVGIKLRERMENGEVGRLRLFNKDKEEKPIIEGTEIIKERLET